MPRRTEVGLVYATGLVQGLALVTFPAASSIFTSPDGYGFSASRYGMMFVPQVILAILASSLGPSLARRWTLKRVLRAGMSADLLAMILLALSRLLQGVPAAAYGVLLVATGALGFRFGTVVMALKLRRRSSLRAAKTGPCSPSTRCSAPEPPLRRCWWPSSRILGHGGCCR